MGYSAARGLPPILDPCSGSRMFYFDRHDPQVLFCDHRKASMTLCDGRTLDIGPDMIVDVLDLPFDDCTFPLVVFDPPHLDSAGDNGWQAKKYGTLPREWKPWMRQAFSECWRVLAENGTLVFKWYEYRIKLREVLACAPCEPVFGNQRPGSSKTHWLVFFKERKQSRMV